MRKLWTCADWNMYVAPNCRAGIRLRIDPGTDPEVRRACKEFVQWMRSYYIFPMRVPIYLKNREYVVSRSGEQCSAIFFEPFEKNVEPYIRISVGDYPMLLENWGKDNALAAILHSIAHELTHYFQWLKAENTGETRQKAREKQARYYADMILIDYAETRDHP